MVLGAVEVGVFGVTVGAVGSFVLIEDVLGAVPEQAVVLVVLGEVLEGVDEVVELEIEGVADEGDEVEVEEEGSLPLLAVDHVDGSAVDGRAGLLVGVGDLSLLEDVDAEEGVDGLDHLLGEEDQPLDVLRQLEDALLGQVPEEGDALEHVLVGLALHLAAVALGQPVDELLLLLDVEDGPHLH